MNDSAWLLILVAALLGLYLWQSGAHSSMGGSDYNQTLQPQRLVAKEEEPLPLVTSASVTNASVTNASVTKPKESHDVTTLPATQPLFPARSRLAHSAIATPYIDRKFKANLLVSGQTT